MPTDAEIGRRFRLAQRARALKKRPNRKPMSPKQRAAISAGQKRRHARNRARKVAP